MKDVLVVGAGPTGLMMAAELARMGFRCRLIDKASGPSVHSKALAIQPRTLEIFSHLGIIEPFLAQGQRVRAVNPSSQGKRLARLGFDGLDSPFPFVLSLEQSKTEKILLECLDVEVEWNVQLVGIEEEGGLVEAAIQEADGRESLATYSWVIGCDGSHSAVRKLLGFPFQGKAFSDVFSLADVAIENLPYPHEEGAAYFDRHGLVALIPMPGSNRYRIVFQLERCRGKFSEQVMVHGVVSSQAIADPALEEVQEVLERSSGVSIRVKDPVWLANFHIHSRLTKSFRHGRIFLAGDSAHIHSPAGGQGMNTGIQDAFNLAWKLHLVHRNLAPESFLDTYTLERRSVASALLKATAFATHMATLKNPFAIRLRNWAISHLAKIDSFRMRLVRGVSQIGIRYPTSPIAVGPRAGMRVPNASLIAETGPVELYSLLKESGLHWLLVFTGPRPSFERMEDLAKIVLPVPAKMILIAQSPEIPSIRGALRDPDGAAHGKFGAKKETFCLIRPDLVCGCHGSQLELNQYFRGIA